jgi:4-amino-4-deoxychorismate lyase
VIRPDDPGLLHGDGIFETIHLRSGVPWLLEEHLARMASSARLLSLDFPPREALETLVHQAATAATTSEAALRLILTRGSALYATVSPLPATALDQRRDGVKALTAEAGVSIQRPAWSLSGAKSLSYAENLAARRWAEQQQADDVILVSTEGWALESPTASLLWLTDGILCTVAPAEAGILPGITAAHLLSRAAELGLEADHRMITREALKDAEAIWLASSLRGLAEVTTLDGTERARSDWTGRLLDLLGF